MSRTLIATLTVALTFIASPAFAQVKQQARSNPGVQVLRGVKTFNASRADLERSGAAALSEARAARSAKGDAVGKKLDALGIKLGDVTGHVRSTLAQLPEGAKDGKTKTARDLAARIAGHADSARAHQRAAKTAFGKGDVEKLRASLDAAERDVRAIDRLSTQLGLIEPVVTR
jgi:phage shock protein A